MSQNKSKVVNKYDTPELPEFNELFNAMLEDFGNGKPSHRIKMLESVRPICNYFFNMGISQNLEHGLKTELQTISDTQQQILELVQNALLAFVGDDDDDDHEPTSDLTLDSPVAAAEIQVL